MKRKPDTQSDKFKEAAEEAGCDPDEARWTERLKKIIKRVPDSEPAKKG